MDQYKGGVTLEPSWHAVLGDEFEKDYMVALSEFLRLERARGETLYPPSNEIFAALNTTPLSATRVVILGQDPYHGEGQAHGLCFSVKSGIKIPPSLRNIYKELAADMGCPTPSHGTLNAWAKQGVLLLNSVLTVRSGEASSHKDSGWEHFTDKIVEILNKEKTNLVFLLWGNYAQKKGNSIDRKKHLVLTAAHPSPLSASRGFFGNHHFSTTNAYLEKHKLKPIDWQLPIFA
ncbi:MAG: uracil-DNA glycosylase [Pseudohongiellaceae bacterium]